MKQRPVWKKDPPGAPGHVDVRVMPRLGATPRPSASQSLCHVLLATLVLGLPASRQLLCHREPIGLLSRMIRHMGNSSGDGTLYTPEDITVCYADNLDCFYLELQVMREEREAHAATLARLLLRLAQMRRQLRRRQCATCRPCEDHPERPALDFLHRLLQLLQRNCQAPTKTHCPPAAP